MMDRRYRFNFFFNIYVFLVFLSFVIVFAGAGCTTHKPMGVPDSGTTSPPAGRPQAPPGQTRPPAKTEKRTPGHPRQERPPGTANNSMAEERPMEKSTICML